MPTYDLLTDDPTTFPNQVRTPDGSAPRNATTEAGPLQDLANRTAFLKRWGPDHMGSILDMRGLVAPQGGDDFFSLEFGHYVFRTAVTAGPEPFCYAANDGTVGRWVSPMIRLLCGQAVPSGSPALIQQSLLPNPPYPRLVSEYVRTCAVFGAGAQHITTSTYVQLNDGANDLSDEVNCSVGDRIHVSIGPIQGNLVAGGSLVVNARVADGGGSHDLDYPIAVAVTGDTSVQTRYLHFVHTANTTTPTIYLQAKCDVGGAGYVYFRAFGGTAASQWARIEVVR